MIRVSLVAAVVAAVLLALVGSAAAPAQKQECSWGASSTFVDENGVQSAPASTGCIP